MLCRSVPIDCELIYHANLFWESANKNTNLSLGTGMGFSYCVQNPKLDSFGRLNDYVVCFANNGKFIQTSEVFNSLMQRWTDSPLLHCMIHLDSQDDCDDSIQLNSYFLGAQKRLDSWFEIIFALRSTIQLMILSELWQTRSEEHTSELQSHVRISYAVFCLKKKKKLLIIYLSYFQ